MDNIVIRPVHGMAYTESIETRDEVPEVDHVMHFLAMVAPRLQQHEARGLPFRVKLKAEFVKEREQEDDNGEMTWSRVMPNFYFECVAQEIMPGVAGARFPTVRVWMDWVNQELDRRLEQQQYRWRLNGLVKGQVLVAPTVRLAAAADSGVIAPFPDDDAVDAPEASSEESEGSAEEKPKRKSDSKHLPQMLVKKRATIQFKPRVKGFRSFQYLALKHS